MKSPTMAFTLLRTGDTWSVIDQATLQPVFSGTMREAAAELSRRNKEAVEQAFTTYQRRKRVKEIW